MAEDLTARVRWMWSQGDYAEVARRLEPAAIGLVDAIGIEPGTRVLDVACGNGNLAVAAARAGASVTACDLTPHMLELGARRAADVGLTIEWQEADARELPYADGAFAVVGSTFGAMFAPDPETVASELFRVTRARGIVAMANYVPRGFLWRMSQVLESLNPQAAADRWSPFRWGDPDEVRRLFGSRATDVDITIHTGQFEADSIAAMWDFWERTNSPQQAMKAMLPGPAYEAVIARQRAIIEELSRTEGPRTILDWEWLQVIATKG